MYLRRFPWAIPDRKQDKSFKAFLDAEGAKTQSCTTTNRKSKVDNGRKAHTTCLADLGDKAVKQGERIKGPPRTASPSGTFPLTSQGTRSYGILFSGSLTSRLLSPGNGDKSVSSTASREISTSSLSACASTGVLSGRCSRCGCTSDSADEAEQANGQRVKEHIHTPRLGNGMLGLCEQCSHGMSLLSLSEQSRSCSPASSRLHLQASPLSSSSILPHPQFSIKCPATEDNDRDASPQPRRKTAPLRTRASSISLPESIFNKLPRETRPILRRMLCVDPRARATMGELLYGKRGASGVFALDEGERCYCEQVESEVDGDIGGEDCQGDAEDQEEDGDGSDPWIRSIAVCTVSQPPEHVHVKMATVEKCSGRKLFF